MALAFSSTPALQVSTFAAGSSFSVTRSPAAAIGDPVIVVTYQTSNTNTCTSVTDAGGNTYTLGSGPHRAGSGLSNTSLYIWYCLNPTATPGAITANWSASANGMVGAVTVTGASSATALAWGQTGLASTTGFQATPGASPSSVATGAALLVFAVSSGSVTSPTHTVDYSASPFNVDSSMRSILASSGVVTPGWALSGSSTHATVAIAIGTAPASVLGSNVTLDNVTTGGGLSSVPGLLSGDVALDPTAVSGSFGIAPAVSGLLTFSAASDKFVRNNDTVIASTAVTLDIDDSSGALMLRTSLTTNSLGFISNITSGSLTPGQTYRVDYKFASGEYGVVYKTAGTA